MVPDGESSTCVHLPATAAISPSTIRRCRPWVVFAAVAAEKGRVRPVICINKIDLVYAADFEPLVGVYSQMGYEVLL